jgi:hypothetical protein
MIKRIFFFTSLLLILVFSSCKKDTGISSDIGYSYFPANIGHWIIYQVDSSYYNDFTATVTRYHFKVKEKIESLFYDNQNRPTLRLERYYMTDSVNWVLKNVWTENLTSTTAEKVEENIRFIKLVFAIYEGRIWNGNAFNSFDPMDYTYVNVNKPYSMDGITYDSTVTVIQKIDTSNLISSAYMEEVYARNIGMIYKRLDTVKTAMIIPPQTIPDTISGVKCTYKIISFGN